MLDRLEDFLLILLPQHLQLLHVDESPPPPPGRSDISLRNGGQVKAVRFVSLAENISLRTIIVLSETSETFDLSMSGAAQSRLCHSLHAGKGRRDFYILISASSVCVLPGPSPHQSPYSPASP